MSDMERQDDSPKITKRNIAIFLAISTVGLTFGYISSRMVASYKENKISSVEGLLWPGKKINRGKLPESAYLELKGFLSF